MRRTDRYGDCTGCGDEFVPVIAVPGKLGQFCDSCVWRIKRHRQTPLEREGFAVPRRPQRMLEVYASLRITVGDRRPYSRIIESKSRELRVTHGVLWFDGHPLALAELARSIESLERRRADEGRVAWQSCSAATAG